MKAVQDIATNDISQKGTKLYFIILQLNTHFVFFKPQTTNCHRVLLM